MAYIYFVLTLLFYILFSISPISSFNEPLERWLVEIKPGKAQCLEDWWIEIGFHNRQYLMKNLPVQNWIVLELPAKYSDSLKMLPCIQSITPDIFLDKRETIPNDPDFDKQDDMKLIGMPSAWDVTTGGLSIRGDTIVIAVIDDGFQTDHEDLIENLWFNWAEVPDDGEDNDGNGYIDDFQGLHVPSGTDNHPILFHGTSVSGIIGARGNNGIGVTGVNWNCKLMLISYNHRISELVEGYQYVIDMRRRYNDTNGEQGAFVVAVNLSSGIDFALPENFPLWCNMYDSLGAVGILGVGSAPNHSHSVDSDGDLPSRCVSPYTIITTNVSPSDVIMDNAGFGRISIDLGAPGEESFTTDINNGYNFFRGTSAAAPHVAGTVGLIYSVPCLKFWENLDENPSYVALQVKNAILSSATPNESLTGITLTGARLQTDSALNYVFDRCNDGHENKNDIRFIAPNPPGLNGTRIFFESLYDITNSYFEIHTLNGARIVSRQITEQENRQGYIHLVTNSFTVGMYVIVLRCDDKISTAKLVIK